VRGDACAKLILIGEHAVVYGVPAIAIPVREMRTTVTIDAAERNGRGVEIADERGVDVEVATSMARLALDQAGLGPVGANIEIRSEIPLGAGLGSSAALAVALVRAAGDGRPEVGAEDVAARALELEKIAHGTPSGIDTTTIAHERPIRFVRGRPPEPLPLGGRVALAVGILPRPEGTTTATLVAGVRRHSEKNREEFRHILLSIGAVADSARTALEDGDVRALGRALDDNQRGLWQLGVSTDQVERACMAARRAGALGAKLSGAGGGGAVIAALRDEDDAPAVVTSLIEHGCEDAFLTVVD